MLKKILKFIIKWFWKKPTTKKKEQKYKPPATEVAHAFIILKYKGKDIQLRDDQVEWFNSLHAKSKKAIVNRFQNKVKKGVLKLTEIDGKKLYVKARGYDYTHHFNK